MTKTVEPAGAANGAKSAGSVAEDGQVSAADEELARQLAERARAEGLSLTGPGGLLGRLTKVVLEGALEGEMDAHLGYGKHDVAGRDGGNSRNGHRDKTVLTDVGPVEISVPRDRDASSGPAIVAKRQRRLAGVDDLVISLVAKGLTTGEVAAHLAEVYGAQVSRETIRCPFTGLGLWGFAEDVGAWPAYLSFQMSFVHRLVVCGALLPCLTRLLPQRASCSGRRVLRGGTQAFTAREVSAGMRAGGTGLRPPGGLQGHAADRRDACPAAVCPVRAGWQDGFRFVRPAVARGAHLGRL